MVAWIVADMDGLNAFGRHMLRSITSPVVGLVLLTLLSIGVIWLAMQWIDRLRIGNAENAQTLKALFQELCQVHRLNRTERKLLSLAAEELPPEQLCCIFIDPRILGRLSISNAPEVDGYAKLAGKLFGDCRG